LTLAIVAFASTTASAGRTVEKYASGKKKLVYSTNSKGHRHGSYTEYWPNGKKKVAAKYRHGKLDGSYVEYDERGKQSLTCKYVRGDLHGPRRSYRLGRTVSEEIWVEGFLALPRSRIEIRRDLTRAQESAVDLAGAPETARGALRRLREYRCAAGVPWENLTLDRDMNEKCAAATEILVRLGRMTHHIDKNPGVPKDIFELGKEGAKKSNLHQIGNLPSSVDGFMRDSGPSNIDAVGHRRWCLGPAMAKTGFGLSGKYVAMWATDKSAETVPQWDIIAFPPRGYMPANLFASTNAWHVSLHPSEYDLGDRRAVRASVRRVPSVTTSRAKIQRIPPLENDHLSTCEKNLGSGPAVIFRPKGATVRAGAVYFVTIEGLTGPDGEERRIEYFVAFF